MDTISKLGFIITADIKNLSARFREKIYIYHSLFLVFYES